MATLRWNQDRVMLAVSRQMYQRAQRAAVAVERQVKERVGVPYPPASQVGMPPRRRTGTLQRSVKATAVIFGFGVRVTLRVFAPYAASLQRRRGRPIAGLPEDARLIVDILQGRR